jgi:hypothetical protein
VNGCATEDAPAGQESAKAGVDEVRVTAAMVLAAATLAA